MNLSNEQIEELRDEWGTLQRTIYGPSDKTRTEFVEKLLTMLTNKTAPQGDAAPDNGIILQTQVAVSVTPERWNELQDELLLWRYRTLKALQHLKGFTGIRDLNELQAILDDDERRWKEIESGISVLLSDSDKAWMVPLAHKNGLTLGDWIIQTVRGAASSSGSAPELKDIKELDQAALDLAEKEYWRDNGDARHNLATAILTYLNAS